MSYTEITHFFHVFPFCFLFIQTDMYMIQNWDKFLYVILDFNFCYNLLAVCIPLCYL